MHAVFLPAPMQSWERSEESARRSFATRFLSVTIFFEKPVEIMPGRSLPEVGKTAAMHQLLSVSIYEWGRMCYCNDLLMMKIG